MRLDDEQIDKINRHLDEKGSPPLICSICHQSKWEIADGVFVSRDQAHIAKLGGGTVIPSIVVICLNCGNTLFFNAIVLGIVQKKEKVNIEEIDND